MKFSFQSDLTPLEISSKLKNVLEFVDPSDIEARNFFLDHVKKTWKQPEHLFFTKQLLEIFNFEAEIAQEFQLEFDDLFENAEDSGISCKRLTHLLELNCDFGGNSNKLDVIIEKAYYHWSSLEFGGLLKIVRENVNFEPTVNTQFIDQNDNLLIWLIVTENKNLERYKEIILNFLSVLDSPTQRKRAQFLLTKLVPGKIRDRLFLVFETLEETEGHIIRQIFPHVKKLLEINSENHHCFNDYLYPVFKRMFTHDNHKIIIEAVQLTLVLDGHLFWKELIYLLFDYVKIQSLYADVDAENSWNGEILPKTAILLQHFCENLDFQNLELKPGKFIFDILIGDQIETSWSFIALAYVCMGFMKIPHESIEKYEFAVSKLYSLNMKCLNYADPIIRLALEEWLFKLISRFLIVDKGIEYANCIGFLFSNYSLLGKINFRI